MEIDYLRKDEGRLLIVAFHGAVTAGDVLQLLDRQASTGAWSYAVLYDERDARVELSADEIRRIAAHAAALSRTHGPRGRVAIVAATDVDYGVNRMVSAYADLADYTLEVFRTVNEALAWLGEPPA